MLTEDQLLGERTERFASSICDKPAKLMCSDETGTTTPQDHRRHLLFFLGAGVSKPSGLPLTGKMEACIFDFDDDLTWWDYGRKGGEFSSSPAAEGARSYPEYANRVRRFLGALRERARAYCRQQKNTYACRRETEGGSLPPRPFRITYEDLYFLCEQITLHGLGETRDLSSGLLADYMREAAADHLLSAPPGPYDDVTYTASLAKNLIRAVIRNQLDVEKDIQGLHVIADAARSDAYGRITVVSLNHDCLLAELFVQEGIEFEDGFADPRKRREPGKSDVRFYEPDRLFEAGARVRVIKPHGSVNWYSAELLEKKSDEDFEPLQVAMAGPPPYEPCLPDRREWSYWRRVEDKVGFSSNPPPQPILLSSSGKESSYGEAIFGDMMAVFVEALHDAHHIAMSGFSWGDPGMCDRVLSALDRDREKRMVMLHGAPPNADYHKKHPISDSWLAGKLGRRYQYGREDRWLCDISCWKELQRVFEKMERGAREGG